MVSDRLVSDASWLFFVIMEHRGSDCEPGCIRARMVPTESSGNLFADFFTSINSQERRAANLS